MYLIGVDYHPSFQTIAFFSEETGECDERELNHSGGEAEKFYRDLKEREVSVRVGMEAKGDPIRSTRRCRSLGSKRLQLELGGGATPFPLKDLKVRDAISIPTAPTNLTN